jgi:hypothetical protein
VGTDLDDNELAKLIPVLKGIAENKILDVRMELSKLRK